LVAFGRSLELFDDFTSREAGGRGADAATARDFSRPLDDERTRVSADCFEGLEGELAVEVDGRAFFGCGSEGRDTSRLGCGRDTSRFCCAWEERDTRSRELGGGAGAFLSRTLGACEARSFSTRVAFSAGALLTAGLAEAGAATAMRRPLVRAVSTRAGATRISRGLTRRTRDSETRSTLRSSIPELRTMPCETGNRVTFVLRARRTWFSCTGTRTRTTLVAANWRVGTKQYQLRLTTTGAPKYPPTANENEGGIGAQPM